MSSRLSKWLALTGRERLLFISACTVLLLGRLVWTVVPFRWVWRLAGGSDLRSTDTAGNGEIAEIRQAIERAGSLVPGATCLTRSLAAAILLRFAGLPHRMVIGVNKNADQGLSAHAWVVSGGHIVAGYLPNLADYIALPIGAAIPPLR